jgi:carboxyl-terminal processing protease
MKRSPSLVVGAVAVALAAGAYGYAQLRAAGAPGNDAIWNTPNGKAFLESLGALRSEYLRPVDDQKLLEGALSGMLYALDDEFTYYIPPAQANTGREDLNGEFFGIGVGILPANKNGTGVQVETVYSGSPAAEAGLVAGDVILKAGDKELNALPLDEAVRYIRGPQGTQVRLVILRDGARLTLNATRRKITKVNVETAVLPGNVGYIAISDFANWKLADQLQAALVGLNKKNVTGLVLDLRGNPGGLVAEAEAVADAFLQKGDIYITRDRSQKVTVEYSAKAQATDFLKPLVVLVNSSSASASEIVTAALQDNGRAKIVGEKTYGKGVANSPEKLSNDGQLNVTVIEWLTPKRNSIFKKGVTPDYPVADTRFEKLLAFEGVNAKPGTQIEVKINGQNLKLTADKDGRFQYQQAPTRQRTSSVQGQATVDLAKDAQLRKALEVLKTSK